jgi:signal transduction histidine kinase
LNDLVDSMLLLARVESSRSPLRCETVRLDELMAEVSDRVGVLAAEKRQEVNLACDLAVAVSTDRRLLRQAVVNILHNAIRYSPAGTRVQVRCLRRDAQAVLHGADEGPGIAPEHQQNLRAVIAWTAAHALKGERVWASPLPSFPSSNLADASTGE